MAEVEIEWDTTEAMRALNLIGSDVRSDLDDMHEEGARIVGRRARDLAPVLDGDLRDSIDWSGDRDAGEVIAGGPRAPHAGPIHFGAPNRPYGPWVRGAWRGGPIRSQPFLTDAANDQERRVEDSWESSIRAIVRRRT